MSKMNSRFKYMYDAAPSVALITKDGTVYGNGGFAGPLVKLDVLDGYWNQPNPAPADQTLAVVMNIDTVGYSNVTAAELTISNVQEGDNFTLYAHNFSMDGTGVRAFTAAIAITDDRQFVIGSNDDETATNIANAINADNAQPGNVGMTAVAVDNLVLVYTTAHPPGTIQSSQGSITISQTFTGGDETYAIGVIVWDNGLQAQIGNGFNISVPGQYVVLLDIDTIKASLPTATGLQVIFEASGTSPAISGYAWISGIIR